MLVMQGEAYAYLIELEINSEIFIILLSSYLLNNRRPTNAMVQLEEPNIHTIFGFIPWYQYNCWYHLNSTLR